MNPDQAAIETKPPVISEVQPPPLITRRRIEVLDVLRGFALLGILVMNIQSFSMIEAAYMNPTAYGDLSGVNFCVWAVSHVFFDQKFMTIFSLLFGAGILLMSEKNEASARSPAAMHYRRMFWLLVIGAAHAHLFWFGDILVTYAFAGSIAFLMRKLQAAWLVVIGLATIALPSLLFVGIGVTVPYWPADALKELQQDWAPGPAAVAQEIQTYRGGWLEQLGHRVPTALLVQTALVVIYTGWRAGGLMLLGMALFKWSILSATKPVRFHATLASLGVLAGLPLILFGVHLAFESDWSGPGPLFFYSQFNYWGSLGLSLSYVSLICLAQRRGWFKRARSLLGSIGRMALTNYLLQTLICTTLFYGHGFGLFGHLERWQQALVVLGVWGAQILFTQAWMRFYAQGPFEYLWRSLTYWRFHPIPRAA